MYFVDILGEYFIDWRDIVGKYGQFGGTFGCEGLILSPFIYVKLLADALATRPLDNYRCVNQLHDKTNQ